MFLHNIVNHLPGELQKGDLVKLPLLSPPPPPHLFSLAFNVPLTLHGGPDSCTLLHQLPSLLILLLLLLQDKPMLISHVGHVNKIYTIQKEKLKRERDQKNLEK